MNRLDTDVVALHPALKELGQDSADQQRAESFAQDLAWWFVGGAREDCGPLARVVTLVAQRELNPARAFCRGRPLLSVEAAAQATAVLWPNLSLLTSVEAVEEGEPEEEELVEDEAEGEGEAALEGSEGGGEGEEDEEEEAGESDDTNDESPQQQQAEGPVDPGAGTEGFGELDFMADAQDDEINRLMDAMKGLLASEERAEQLLEPLGEAAEQAALGADEVTRQLRTLLPGLGWDQSVTALESTLLQRLTELSSLLSQLPQLKHIADVLGRMEMSDSQPGLSEGGNEEVVGVHLSGDVSTALPTELGLLADEDTEDLFYQRWLERRLVSLQLAGSGIDGVSKPENRGPILACVDTSGSMEGAPEWAAKALVLAVCRRALPQGRAVFLLLFGGRGERTEVELRRGKGGLDAMLSFLMAGFHGGTDFDEPLIRALELIGEEQWAAADILIVTDGLGHVAPAVVHAVREVKEKVGLKVWSVVFGSANSRGVAPVSDHVLLIDPSEPQSLGNWMVS